MHKRLMNFKIQHFLPILSAVILAGIPKSNDFGINFYPPQTVLIKVELILDFGCNIEPGQKISDMISFSVFLIFIESVEFQWI